MSPTPTAPEECPPQCCGILCPLGTPAFQPIRGQAVLICSVHSVFLMKAEALLITEEIPGNFLQAWSLGASKLGAWTKRIPQHPTGACSAKAEAEKAKSLLQTTHPHMPEPTALVPWDPPKHSQLTRGMKLCSPGALSSARCLWRSPLLLCSLHGHREAPSCCSQPSCSGSALFSHYPILPWLPQSAV